MVNDQETDFRVDRENKKIIATRIFGAPRGVVWKAVTDPSYIVRWWGPRRLETKIEKFELHPGGAWRFVQHDPAGKEFAFNGVTKEIVPLERVVQTFNFEGIPPGHELVQTMTLEDALGGKTKLTQIAVYQNLAGLEGMLQSGMESGLRESMDRLAELIQPKMELTLTRSFDVPREMVWRAWTDPVLMARWWGPATFTNPVCELDVRPGGAIRIDMQGPDGAIYPMLGNFEETKEPERLVFLSHAFGDEDGKNGKIENRNTITFEDQGKKTKMTLHVVVLRSTPDMEGPLSGMEMGWAESFDKLAGVLNVAAAVNFEQVPK